MGSNYKVLGQSNPPVATDTTLYTVPAGAQAIGSTLTICNQSGIAVNFRIAVRPAGAALAAKHYIAYDSLLSPNDTVTLTIGLTLAETDVVTVRASSATISFSLFGSEIT